MSETSSRQTTGRNDYLEIEKADGRTVKLNWPKAGEVTIRHPDGREEVLSRAEYVAQELG